MTSLFETSRLPLTLTAIGLFALGLVWSHGAWAWTEPCNGVQVVYRASAPSNGGDCHAGVHAYGTSLYSQEQIFPGQPMGVGLGDWCVATYLTWSAGSVTPPLSDAAVAADSLDGAFDCQFIAPHASGLENAAFEAIGDELRSAEVQQLEVPWWLNSWPTGAPEDVRLTVIDTLHADPGMPIGDTHGAGGVKSLEATVCPSLGDAPDPGCYPMAFESPYVFGPDGAPQWPGKLSSVTSLTQALWRAYERQQSEQPQAAHHVLVFAGAGPIEHITQDPSQALLLELAREAVNHLNCHGKATIIAAAGNHSGSSLLGVAPFPSWPLGSESASCPGGGGGNRSAIFTAHCLTFDDANDIDRNDPYNSFPTASQCVTGGGLFEHGSGQYGIRTLYGTSVAAWHLAAAFVVGYNFDPGTHPSELYRDIYDSGVATSGQPANAAGGYSSMPTVRRISLSRLIHQVSNVSPAYGAVGAGQGQPPELSTQTAAFIAGTAPASAPTTTNTASCWASWCGSGALVYYDSSQRSCTPSDIKCPKEQSDSTFKLGHQTPAPSGSGCSACTIGLPDAYGTVMVTLIAPEGQDMYFEEVQYDAAYGRYRESLGGLFVPAGQSRRAYITPLGSGYQAGSARVYGVTAAQSRGTEDALLQTR